jgi:hypothetical protein
MKNYILLFTVLILLGCKKDNGIIIQPPPVHIDSSVCQLGLIRFVKNGDIVSTQIDSIFYAFHDHIQDSVFAVSVYTELQPLIVEEFYMGQMPFKVGKSNLTLHTFNTKNAITFASITVDHDQGAGWYIPDTTKMNTIEVIKIDREKQTIQGRFQATLVSEKPPLFTFLQDTLRISDGVFHLKYRKWE